MTRRHSTRILLGLIALLVIGGGVYAVMSASVDPTESIDVDSAATALRDGDLETAAALYGRLAAADPSNLEFNETELAIRAQLASTRRQRERLAFRTEAWLRAHPERERPRRLLVDLAVELERYHDALAHLAVLERNADDPAFVLVRAVCLRALGRMEDEVDVLEGAIDRFPDSLAIAERLADALVETSRWNDATNVMHAIGTRQPSDPRVLRSRVRHARRVEDLAAAEELANRLVNVDPTAVGLHATVLLERFEESRRRGDWDAALEFRRRAAELVLTSPVTDRWTEVLRARFENGSAARAERLGLLVASHSESEAIRMALFEALLAADRGVEARAMLDEIENEAARGYVDARLTMAGGRWSEAIDTLNEARRRAAGDDRFVEPIELALAECHARTGDRTACFVALRRALKTNPRSASARLGLASLAEDRGDLEPAIAEYRSLPLDPVATERLFDLVVARNTRLPDIAQDWSEAERLVRASENGATNVTVARRMLDVLALARSGRPIESESERRIEGWRPRYVEIAIDAALDEADIEPKSRIHLSRP